MRQEPAELFEKAWHDGIRENAAGMFEVFVAGKKIACEKTNADAWREYERATHELKSKAEETADWAFRQRSGEPHQT